MSYAALPVLLSNNDLFMKHDVIHLLGNLCKKKQEKTFSSKEQVQKSIWLRTIAQCNVVLFTTHLYSTLPTSNPIEMQRLSPVVLTTKRYNCQQ